MQMLTFDPHDQYWTCRSHQDRNSSRGCHPDPKAARRLFEAAVAYMTVRRHHGPNPWCAQICADCGGRSSHCYGSGGCAAGCRDAGCAPVGPCSTSLETLALLGQTIPDYAILDITLRGSSCFGIARELRQLRVLFVIHSGWALFEDVPEELIGAPWLQKPASFQTLVRKQLPTFLQRRFRR